MEISTTLKKELFGERLNTEKILLYSIYVLSFFVPLIIGKPQLLIGSFINTLTIYSSLKYGFKKSIPVYLLPSIAATSAGLLFEGATFFLLYLMPFIMISNGILGYFVTLKKNSLIIMIGVILKALFLYIVVNILIDTIGLPQIFLTSMGYIQVITATIGAVIALLLYIPFESKS
ncbi:hypothetical protein A3K02_02820 [candidate division WS6 bacterium RIFOXYD1_FULL_33_8]|nr:MAG: hypothetical protein UR36_C0007G0015 [candidate division WS6 bacterium GW2011_GWF1_33_233]KKP82154.1 MAG: hypothetical protein UR84_C0007G0015 [candidate division WS6 bacterium GW2011_GWD1_35_594]OGC43041.1 MAG: hypothetical protein A3K02_02820 [candidate division WS6 bacterium RIFOXYD1_FULL_33_8]